MLKAISCFIFILVSAQAYALECLEQKATSSRHVFVWPTDGWLQATEHYRSGRAHSGVADISIEHFAPIFASRGGTVRIVQSSVLGGLGVSINHENGYRTFYSHLIESLVNRGDVVKQGQLIGYGGKMGNAFSAHVHFNITKDGKSVHIPEVEIGEWVKAGRRIPLKVADLKTQKGVKTTYCAVAQETMPTFSKATFSKQDSQNQIIVGHIYKVVSSHNGYLRLELPHGTFRYIQRNRMRFPQSKNTTVLVKRGAKLYTQSNTLYDELTVNMLRTRYEDPKCETKEFVCIVYRKKGSSRNDLRKVARADVEHTDRKRVVLYSKTSSFREAPTTSSKQIFYERDTSDYGSFSILEVKDGWYKVKHRGRYVWFPGWYAGPSI